jgi:predicted PurR-regulated permease PerM
LPLSEYKKTGKGIINMNNTTGLDRLLLFAVSVLFLLVIWYVIDILLIIFIGLLVALLLDGISSWISRKTPLSRGMALGLVILGILLGVVMIGILIVPPLGEQVEALRETIPEAADELSSELERYEWGKAILDSVPDEITVRELLNGSVVGQSAWSRVLGTFASAFAVLTNVVVILFIGITVALETDFHIRSLLKLVPPQFRDQGRSVLGKLGQRLKEWLAVRLFSVFTTTILTTIGLTIIGIPAPFALGVFAGALAIIPVLGPLIGAVPGVLLAFTVGPLYPVYAIIMYTLVQQLEEYGVIPLLERQTLALSPALMISVQLVLGSLIGFLGIALAAPLTVAGVVIVYELYIKQIDGEADRRKAMPD